MKTKRRKKQAVICFLVAMSLCGCKKNVQKPAETVLMETQAVETTIAETQETVYSCEVSGHTWTETEYTWINEDGACEAKRSCTACEKQETEVVSAQYSGEGETVEVVAEFKNPEFKSQTMQKKLIGDDACFVASDTAGKPGDTVEVAVSIHNNPGIIALGLQVGYDAEQLELLEVKDNGMLPNPMFSESLAKNPYYISWNDALARGDCYNNGNLAVLVFRIREQAKTGVANISLTYKPTDVINWELENQLFATVNGTVTINASEETLIPVPRDPTLKTS